MRNTGLKKFRLVVNFTLTVIYIDFSEVFFVTLLSQLKVQTLLFAARLCCVQFSEHQLQVFGRSLLLKWGLIVNCKRTKCMLFVETESFIIVEDKIKTVKSFKYLDLVAETNETTEYEIEKEMTLRKIIRIFKITNWNIFFFLKMKIIILMLL